MWTAATGQISACSHVATSAVGKPPHHVNWTYHEGHQRSRLDNAWQQLTQMFVLKLHRYFCSTAAGSFCLEEKQKVLQRWVTAGAEASTLHGAATPCLDCKGAQKHLIKPGLGKVHFLGASGLYHKTLQITLFGGATLSVGERGPPGPAVWAKAVSRRSEADHSSRVMLTWFPALDSQVVTPNFPPSGDAGLEMATPSFVTAAPITLHPELHCWSLHDVGRAMYRTWMCPSWGLWELYATGSHLTQRLGGDGRKFAICYFEGKSTSRATKLTASSWYM